MVNSSQNELVMLRVEIMMMVGRKMRFRGVIREELSLGIKIRIVIRKIQFHQDLLQETSSPPSTLSKEPEEN